MWRCCVLYGLVAQSLFCCCLGSTPPKYFLGESRRRFKECLAHCIETGCVDALTIDLPSSQANKTDCKLAQACTNFTHKPKPWSLSWTRWTCHVRGFFLVSGNWLGSCAVEDFWLHRFAWNSDLPAIISILVWYYSHMLGKMASPVLSCEFFVMENSQQCIGAKIRRPSWIFYCSFAWLTGRLRLRVYDGRGRTSLIQKQNSGCEVPWKMAFP